MAPDDVPTTGAATAGRSSQVRHTIKLRSD
jgi:hypothetical protein